MTLEQEIRRLARQARFEDLFGASFQIITGAIVSAVVFGPILLLTWLALRKHLPWGPPAPLLVAAGLTASVFLLCLFGASRQVDPFGDLPRLEPWKKRLMAKSSRKFNMLVLHPRALLAGAAMIVLSGPDSLVRGVQEWRHRLRANGSTIRAAAALLAASPQRPCADTLEVPQAAMLLRRLGLVKAIPDGQTLRIARTRRGEELLAGRRQGGSNDWRRGVRDASSRSSCASGRPTASSC